MRRVRLAPNRRGATIVLVALLTVPLLAIAAFAIDASWWQVGATQLQTSSDAGALAAARALELYRNDANIESIAEGYAIQTATTHKAFAQPIALPVDDIDPMFWDPVTKTAAASTWELANAVEVTTSGAGTRIFSGVVRSTSQTVTRKAIAWIANIQNGKCIKPWALPYTVLYDAVEAATGLTSSIPPTAPSTNPPFRNNLTSAQIAKLDQLANATPAQAMTARTVILRGPNTENVNFPTTAIPASLSSGQQWYAYNYSGNASGPTTYQWELGNCGSSATTVTIAGATGTSVATAGGNVECWTVLGLQQNNGNTCTGGGPNAYNWLNQYGCSGGSTNGCPSIQTCQFKPVDIASTADLDAGCYPAGATTFTDGNRGVEVYTAWGDGTGNGANFTSIRQVGRFRVMCMFRNYMGGSNTAPRTSAHPLSPNETCTVPNGSTYRNLPAGTIVGVIGAVGAPTVDANTVYGNTAALEQKLMLVQ
jgi:Flp pilus assembly protein TadG